MSTASDLLTAYVNCETAILQGQSIRLGDRMLTMADLQFVQSERMRLERRVADEAAAAAGRTGLGYSVARLDQ